MVRVEADAELNLIPGIGTLRLPPVDRTRRLMVREREVGWWGKQDSNLRRLSQRIYSPPPLPLGTFPHLG
jgi:hypothetical protein